MVLGLGVSFVTSKASTYPPVRETGNPLEQRHQRLGAHLHASPAAEQGRQRALKLERQLSLC